MKWFKKVGVFLLILLPILLAAILPTGAEAFALRDAQVQDASAQTSDSREIQVKALRVILEYEPWRYSEWNRLGELQYALGDYQAAINTFQVVAKAEKFTSRSEYEYGKCWLALGKIANAQEVFRDVSTRGVVDTDFLVELAQVQESINDSYGTLATLLEAHGLAPNDHHINYLLGVQFTAAQPDDAIFFLNDALKDKNYQQASTILIEVINATAFLGQDASRFLYIGQQLSKLGEWEAAGSAFLKAATLDPKNAIAWAMTGEAVQHVNGAGYPYLAKALALDPHSDIINGLVALYYRRQAKYEIALDYLYKAAENNPNESTWQIEIGATLALQGNLEDALMHFQMATMMDPDNWVAWKQEAAFCVIHNYQVDTAGYESARKALLLYPDSPSLLDLMGSVYMIMGELDDAEKFYLQANQVAPNQAEILYHLGQLYLEKKDTEKALLYLKQAAIFATDNRIRENANDLIKMNGG